MTDMGPSPAEAPRPRVDHMRLYGGPLLIASLLLAATSDLNAEARLVAPVPFDLARGATAVLMVVTVACMVPCLVRDVRGRTGAEASLPGRVAGATSRLALALAATLALATLAASIL